MSISRIVTTQKMNRQCTLAYIKFSFISDRFEMTYSIRCVVIFTMSLIYIFLGEQVHFVHRFSQCQLQSTIQAPLNKTNNKLICYDLFSVVHHFKPLYE